MGYVNKTYLSTQFKNFADKIAKVFSKIGHTHTKADITNFPTSMPANGGNADTVGGHTVGVNVPADAKFTDTNTWRPQPDWNATSGDAVIKNKPTIPTNTNQLTNGAGYITGINKSMVVNALGYTPPTTDTNTWRGIQDNLSSTSTGDSLSANQGRVLRERIDSTDSVKVSSTSNTTFYKISNMSKFRDTANCYISTEAGAFIWGISAFSDKRLKKNISDSELKALDKVDQIKFRSFDFVDERYGDHEDIGYIADELKEVFPECVVSIPQDKETCGYDELYQVEDKAMIKYLGKAIQELHTLVKQQNEEIESLKQKINSLKNKED